MSKSLKVQPAGCEIGENASDDLAISKVVNTVHYIHNKLVTLAMGGKLKGKTVIIRVVVR
jgi:hypothetical protein